MNPNWYGVGAILMWSSMGLLIAMSNMVPPLQLVGMTWFLGFVFLGSYYLAKGERILSHFKRPLSDYLFLGMGICVYTILIYYSFYTAPPFEANALNYLWPLLLTVFLNVFQGIKIKPYQIGGILLGFAGCVTLFAYRYGDTEFQGLTIGHFMAVAAATIWALYSCFAKSKNYPTAFMVPIFLISSLICFVGHCLFEQTVWPNLNTWFVVILLGGFRIAYAFWDYAIRHGDRQLISSLVYFVPLLSTVFMILGGYGTASYIIGLAAFMIIAGCLVVNIEQIRNVFFKK